MTANHQPWSPDEDAYMRAEWVRPDTRARVMAKHLGRSTDSLTYRALDVLGLGRKPKFASAENAARDARLATLWASPLRTTEIGKQMGMTKNATIGLAHRLGLPPKAKPEPLKRRRPPTPPSFWTAETIAELRKLYADGVTTTRIATLLGSSRGAVCSQVHRLNLPRRGRRAMQFKSTKTRQVTTLGGPELQQVHPAPKMKVHAAGTGAKIVADLAAHECKWPVGEDPARGNAEWQLFCAEGAQEGLPYCMAHRKIAGERYRTPEQRAADEARTANMRAAKAGKPNQNTAFFANRGGRAA